jgi:DNA-directed RNA polymerase subunit alpha
MTTKLIHEPRLNEVNKVGDNGMLFVIGALYNGYGHTLGNSLRRVLLSSIKGAAITALKIEGVNHEYTTVAGVREDVVDIMQNLKKITFKAHTDKPVELYLTKKGAGAVTASDFKTNADVEIANPDQVIANLESDGKLDLTVVVESGVGYQSTEKSASERLHGDMIALDAIFSPVSRVRYEVDDDRVGDDFNLQKLLLTVETDGTITPREAVEQASAILVNQYTALAGATKVETMPALGLNDDDSEWLTQKVEDLKDLSTRTVNSLQENGIKTLRDLITKSEDELRELRGFGDKAFKEVAKLLEEYKDA